MTTRLQALEQELAHRMQELGVMAELAEEGQEAAESRGLDLVREVDRLEQELAVERTRPEPQG